jgi:aminoglycoside 3-N-acetyltransferase
VSSPSDETEVSKRRLVSDLKELGIQAGMGLMVHSSLKSLGRVAGGPRTVVKALMEVITPRGTLMMPSFNHGAPFEDGGEGHFDPRRTPTTNGAIPDCFWRMPGVERSLNPTHSFAVWGRQAKSLTRGHHKTITMGPESPLGLLNSRGGHCLLLGVTYKVNTFHHVVEMSTGAPCLGLRTEAYPMILPGGRKVTGRTWGWRARGCPLTDQARYARFMRKRGLQKVGPVGESQSIFFKLSDCYDVISELLVEGMGRFPPCSRCRIRPRRVRENVPSDWDADRNAPMSTSKRRRR